MERYYRFHSKIYDATRWSFLFGRGTLVEAIAVRHAPVHILEVGCGTGSNLINLACQFPQARLAGLDVSEAMLAVARKRLGSLVGRVNLVHAPYDQPLHTTKLSTSPDPFDLVVCSYSLTMINPGWDQAIEAAYDDLAPGGLIGVVDFHDSPVALFQRWMGLNHVKLEGQLLPTLRERFEPFLVQTRPAYGGLWRYLLFIGEKEG
jgi:S-adenosylmethionine-diacylgycerolhomoserine-N-methlytransferase